MKIDEARQHATTWVASITSPYSTDLEKRAEAMVELMIDLWLNGIIYFDEEGWPRPY